MSARPPLYYTFGNHMHWVDMQWLWGYHVLPGSVDDMLRLIDETGARGNVNFDAVGYEKMAVECPEHLAKLRDAVVRGLVEPVGCSYGQPYGLFHGGESNIRQLTYGVRTTRRLLGVRPRTFWEEEFYFFPQLPQMLAQCGYTGASLFFQWTWHTPEVPKEPCSLILWEGADGTRLPTLPRNELNVHQWPEDFDGLLDKAGAWLNPAVVQWLELMPSKDWMCRSEVLLPRLRELMKDERFDVRPRTAGRLIEELLAATPSPPVKHYTMDDVWHGMTLGKNGDAHPRRSLGVEHRLLDAESISAVASLFGRPYPRWDVYPTWELEEAWRELLAAQHHDNHECEGLCGDIARPSFDRADGLATTSGGAAYERLSDPESKQVRLRNPFGAVATRMAGGFRAGMTSEVPAFGYVTIDRKLVMRPKLSATTHEREGDQIILRRGRCEARFSTTSGALLDFKCPAFPDGLADGLSPLFQLVVGKAATPLECEGVNVNRNEWGLAGMVTAAMRLGGDEGFELEFEFAADGSDCLDVSITHAHSIGKPGPGLLNSVRAAVRLREPPAAILADSPFAADFIREPRDGARKYPRGDWMTSPQWFEQVRAPFTSHSFCDLLSGQDATAPGLLVLHDGSQQFFKTSAGVDVVLTAYDPWDEARYEVPPNVLMNLRLMPHMGTNSSDRVRATWAIRGRSPLLAPALIPGVFGPLSLENAPNVLAHAFFRESMKSGEHLPHWAGHRMFEASGGLCDHPFVIRLVEWDGQPAEVTLKLAGPVAMAAKANLLGEVLNERPRGAGIGPAGWSPLDTGWLECAPCEPPAWAVVGGKPIEFLGKPIEWTQVRFAMRPREIATIYADMVMGRKQFRDLDAKREVWATVHKESERK